MTVAYHDACHLAHAQGVRAQPRRLLEAIPGLELREIAEPELCCGSAGIYNILNPEPARELGDRKAANIVATGAQVLVTANPGCLMQVTSAIERVRATRWGWPTPSRCSTPPSAGCPPRARSSPPDRHPPTSSRELTHVPAGPASRRRLARPQRPVRA